MSVQVHNAEPELKSHLRSNLVTALGGPKKTRVIETHAGPAIMRGLAYKGVADWLGIDQDPESPGSIHADNRLVLRAIDLQRFNLFDVDAFGSPWEQLWIVAQRRTIAKGEILGMALTLGLQGAAAQRSANLKFAGWSKQMVEAMGADVATPHKHFTGERGAELVAQRLVLTWFPQCKVLNWWSGTSKSRGAWYWGVVLEGC